MKRKILLLALFMLFCHICHSQDILTLKNGEQSVVKIESVSDDTIVYRLWSNLNGPIRTTSVKKVKSIQYANGQKETFMTDTEIQDNKERIKDSLDLIHFTPKLVLGAYFGPQLCRTSIHEPGAYYDKENGYRISPTIGVNAILDLTYYTSLYGGLGYSIEGGHFESYNDQEYRCDYLTLDAGICIYRRHWIIALRTAFLTNATTYQTGEKFGGKENYTPVRYGVYWSYRNEFGDKKQHGIEFYNCSLYTNIFKAGTWTGEANYSTDNRIWGIKYTYHFISKELKNK